MERDRASSFRIQVPAAFCTILLIFAGTVWGKSAQEILKESGIKGGLVVHIGCGDGKLTAALYANDSYLIHGLEKDAKSVEKARDYISRKGLYGKVSVEQWTGDHLPYSDNVVNLLVAEKSDDVSMDEVRRVLCPNGVAYIKHGKKWNRIVNP